MEKRGQTTIFIIIAIMVIALGIILYLFFPKIKTNLGFSSENPDVFMQNCIEDSLKEKIEEISLHGGSLNPEHYYLYDESKIEYLCYSEENYRLCVIQQPMLKKHIEEEIKESIKEQAYSCLDDLEESYEKKGYNVALKKNEMEVSIVPERILVKFNSSLILAGEESKSYKGINVVINNNLYEVVMITNSILNMENSYGDSETTTYMSYYPELKVEKKKQSDGTTIYILTERDTGNKFQFASRSMAWPAGY